MKLTDEYPSPFDTGPVSSYRRRRAANDPFMPSHGRFLTWAIALVGIAVALQQIGVGLDDNTAYQKAKVEKFQAARR